MSTVDPARWSPAARQEGDRIATLLATSPLTQHLGIYVRRGLLEASLIVGFQIQDEQEGAPFRWKDVNELIAKIKARAKKNGDDKGVIKSWERKVRHLLTSAGETDFAFDHVKIELKEVARSVRTNKMSSLDPQSNKYRLLSSFTPKIVVYLRPRNEEEENLAFNGVLKKEYTNGQGIWMAYITERINLIEKKVDIRVLDALYLTTEVCAQWRRKVETYFDTWRGGVLVLSAAQTEEQQLTHWRDIERAVKVFENLVDQPIHILDLEGQAAPVARLDHFVARLTLWKPTPQQLQIMPVVPQQHALDHRVFNPIKRDHAPLYRF